MGFPGPKYWYALRFASLRRWARNIDTQHPVWGTGIPRLRRCSASFAEAPTHGSRILLKFIIAPVGWGDAPWSCTMDCTSPLFAFISIKQALDLLEHRLNVSK